MKLTRRRLLVASVVAVAMGGGAWFALADHGPPYGVTRSAYQAIRLGMTREEAERAVGRRDDQNHYMPHLMFFLNVEHESNDSLRSLAFRPLKWADGGLYIEVWLNDDDGLVAEKWFYADTTWERLLRQLRSAWAKLGF